ncbi:MAG TPA: hypothetical protein VF490_05855 [Chryseosolibacter sp.]
MKKVTLTNPVAIARLKKFLADKAFIRKKIREGKASEIKSEVTYR